MCTSVRHVGALSAELPQSPIFKFKPEQPVHVRETDIYPKLCHAFVTFYVTAEGKRGIVDRFPSPSYACDEAMSWSVQKHVRTFSKCS